MLPGRATRCCVALAGAPLLVFGILHVFEDKTHEETNSKTKKKTKGENDKTSSEFGFLSKTPS
eukprot:m.147150 g.147150  ORF g.147150 m.147150 type:complete len:63 (+) comp24341_c2_seq1:41-229(+)